MAFQMPFAGAAQSAGSAVSRVFSPITSRLGRRGTLVVRYVGFVLFALVVFVFALQATFPYDRVRDKAIEALAPNWDLTISEVHRGIIPGNATFVGVTLRSRPTKPDEPVTTIVIKEVDVKLGLLALIGMNISANLDLKIGTPKGYGHITGNITLPKFAKAGIKLDLEGSELPGESLPLRNQLGLPMTGKLDFAIDLDVPVTKNKMGRVAYDWTKVDGSINLSCPTGCTLGDGHTKLKPLLKNRTNQAMVGDGIDFGEVHITSLDAHAVFTPAVGEPDAHSSGYKPGKFEVTKFDVKSNDGELHVDYMMTMASTIDESMVAGCLRFKASDNLLKKDETKKTYAAISTTGAELRSDGLFHIKLSDRFKDMKRLNAECGPTTKGGTGEDFGPGHGMTTRPTITAVPDIRPGVNGSGAFTPVPPPPENNPPPPPVTPPADAGTVPTTLGTAPPPPNEHEHTEGAAAGAGSAEPHSP